MYLVLWVAGLSRTFEAVFYNIVICYFCVRMWCVLQQSVQDETPRMSMLWGFKDVFSTLLSLIVIQVMQFKGLLAAA